MAVTFDAKMTSGNSADGLNQQASAAVSISSTGMTVGTATLLVGVIVLQGNPSGIAMTWNSVAMTQQIAHTVAATATVAIFTLINPTSGNKTLAASWSGAVDCYMSCASFAGTDTVTGVNASDNITADDATTITVTSSSDGATVAVFGVDGAAPTVNFTKIFSTAPLNPGGGASYQLSGTSNAHTFTGAGGTHQSLAGVHIIAAAGGGSPDLTGAFIMA